MQLTTERLVLRPWHEKDAPYLFVYAGDPAVGPAAGWPPHRSVEESLDVIRHVLSGAQCYAICEKGNGTPIGAIELKCGANTGLTEREDECELGYWLGKPFWGRGYVPEAAEELIRYAFEALGMTAIWCCSFEGNRKSQSVQKKLGFRYHHSCGEVPVPLLNETRAGRIAILTKAQWRRSRAPAL
ncbi:MAG TPA: GNAT family N-acetyltransferase [Candidatus Aphodomonas merdavium]|nr:GNAT family N-acetyltransferase [Candidatus Aphodomonas merdavium]